MNTRILSSMTVITALSLAACAGNEVAAPPPPVVTATEKYDAPDRLERVVTVNASAVVTKINQSKRLVTLKASDGSEQTIEVGPEVKNLAQVKKGDMVTVNFVKSAEFQLLKPGSAKLGAMGAEGVETAKPGDKPAGVAGQTVTVVTKVVKVDKKAPSITLQDKDGEVVTLPVQDAKRLDPVKAGDLLAITFNRAVAIVVESPKK